MAPKALARVPANSKRNSDSNRYGSNSDSNNASILILDPPSTLYIPQIGTIYPHFKGTRRVLDYNSESLEPQAPKPQVVPPRMAKAAAGIEAV